MELGGTEKVILNLCRVFRPLVKNIVVCSCGGVYVAELEKMGIKHYHIPDITIRSPRVFLEVGRTLKKIIDEEKITIVHTHITGWQRFMLKCLGYIRSVCL